MTGSSLREREPKTPAVMGALGENRFEANGDMVRDMLMYIVKDGKAVIYK